MDTTLEFDDSYWATLLRPSLTMVHQPAREIGMTAARMLIEYIDGRPNQTSVQRLPTRLMVRDSCAPPAGAEKPSRLGAPKKSPAHSPRQLRSA